MEIYRHLIDDFVIGYCQDLNPRDFKATPVDAGKRRGKKLYLAEEPTEDILEKLSKYFQKKFVIPRTRRGARQTFDTLINEESGRMMIYLLRSTKAEWIPRIARP